jgi:type IV secretion system protein VirB5
MKKTIIATLIGTLFTAPAWAGLPVYDAINNMTAITNQAKNIAQYIQMVSQLKNQLAQAQQMFNSMNGVRGMAAILNNPASRQYLPRSASEIYSLGASGGNFAGLSGSIQSIKAAAQVMKPSDVGNPTTAAMLNRQQDQLATMQATAESAYNAAGARFDNLQTLVNTVDLANDPKAAADLSNRISAENVMMQNELAKLNMLAAIHNAQEKQLAQQGRESIAKMGKGTPVYVTGF